MGRRKPITFLLPQYASHSSDSGAPEAEAAQRISAKLTGFVSLLYTCFRLFTILFSEGFFYLSTCIPVSNITHITIIIHRSNNSSSLMAPAKGMVLQVDHHLLLWRQGQAITTTTDLPAELRQTHMVRADITKADTDSPVTIKVIEHPLPLLSSLKCSTHKSETSIHSNTLSVQESGR
jgi:hypothetical protein